MRPLGVAPRLFPFRSLVLALALAAGPVATAGATVVVSGPAGLTARVHLPQEIAAELVRQQGRVYVAAPAAGGLELLTGPDDERLRRATDAFHPHDEDEVARAVSDMSGIDPQLGVDIFLLPAPPADLQGSFARGRAVFLSPGFGPVDPATTAYACAHELGHVLASAYLDPRPDRWREYERLRGLSPQANGPEAPHAERAREILAEDVRQLFGSPLARSGGTIENGRLPLPAEVTGLREFLAACLRGAPPAPGGPSCRAFPNPCNPLTTVRLEVPPPDAGAAAALTVCDLRGRVVRRLAGGERSGGEVLFVWDGRDDGGRPAPSGCYLCRIVCGTTAGGTSVVLAR